MLHLDKSREIAMQDLPKVDTVCVHNFFPLNLIFIDSAEFVLNASGKRREELPLVFVGNNYEERIPPSVGKN